MTFLKSSSAEPQPLLITFGKSDMIDLFVKSGTSLADINRLHQIAATVLVEQGHVLADATVVVAEGPNPLNHLVLQLTTDKTPQLADINRLIQVLRPSHAVPATLATQYRPSKLVHYRIVLPLSCSPDWQQALAGSTSPRGMETRGYEAEFWLTNASSLDEIWREAQVLASKVGALLIGNVATFGRSLAEMGN